MGADSHYRKSRNCNNAPLPVSAADRNEEKMC